MFARWNKLALLGLTVLFHCHPDCFAQSNFNTSQSFARKNTMGRVWTCASEVQSDPKNYFHQIDIVGMTEKQCEQFKKYWDKFQEDNFKKSEIQCIQDSNIIRVVAYGSDLHTFLETLTRVTKELGW